MPFGKPNAYDGRTQKDLVDEVSPQKKGITKTDLHLPGLEFVLEMSEDQLVEFFTTALKTRSRLMELDFTLGKYKIEEVPARIGNVEQLHNKSFRDIARAITMAILQDDKIVGVRLKTERVQDSYISSMWVKLADKVPQGPTRVNGELIKGDKEFNPKLTIYFIQA